MSLLRVGEPVRVEPTDKIGEKNWATALGGRLDQTFPVAFHRDVDIIGVRAKNGRAVEVPAKIVRRVAEI